jgi:hypothetical protein
LQHIIFRNCLTVFCLISVGETFVQFLQNYFQYVMLLIIQSHIDYDAISKAMRLFAILELRLIVTNSLKYTVHCRPSILSNGTSLRGCQCSVYKEHLLIKIYMTLKQPISTEAPNEENIAKYSGKSIYWSEVSNEMIMFLICHRPIYWLFAKVLSWRGIQCKSPDF